jgi:hypothetical protein
MGVRLHVSPTISPTISLSDSAETAAALYDFKTEGKVSDFNWLQAKTYCTLRILVSADMF